MKLKEFKEFLSRLIDGKKSGVLKVYRKTFGDPLLYAYFLKGVPVYASSFVVRGKWYEGLLTRKEVDDNIFGNIFRYAYDKHGKRFIEHIVKYSQNVLKEVLKSLAESGWEVEVEFLERSEEDIKESIGITRSTTIEGWAKSLLSVGATAVYIPSSDKVIGMMRGDTLKKVYNILLSNFGDVDAIYSTPLANAFVIHKDGEPLLVFISLTIGFEEVESFKRLLSSTPPVPYEGEIEVGRSYDFPVIDGVGRPFAFALRKGMNTFSLAIVRENRVAHVYTMDVDGVFSMILDLAERLSAELYRVLEKVENENIPQTVMDLQIRILMMSHPHPEDFRKVALEKLVKL